MDDSAGTEPRETEPGTEPGGIHRIPGAAHIREGEARKVLLHGEEGKPPIEVALCRVDGRLHAVDSLCPHEGGRIAAGPLVEGRYLSCPLHLYKFDPETGAAIDVPCPPAKTYAVREVGGDVEVTLDS